MDRPIWIVFGIRYDKLDQYRAAPDSAEFKPLNDILGRFGLQPLSASEAFTPGSDFLTKLENYSTESEKKRIEKAVNPEALAQSRFYLVDLSNLSQEDASSLQEVLGSDAAATVISPHTVYVRRMSGGLYYSVAQEPSEYNVTFVLSEPFAQACGYDTSGRQLGTDRSFDKNPNLQIFKAIAEAHGANLVRSFDKEYGYDPSRLFRVGLRQEYWAALNRKFEIEAAADKADHVYEALKAYVATGQIETLYRPEQEGLKIGI